MLLAELLCEAEPVAFAVKAALPKLDPSTDALLSAGSRPVDSKPPKLLIAELTSGRTELGSAVMYGGTAALLPESMALS